jgi:hypothetical protein
MSKDYFPAQDAEFDAWLANFAAELAARATTFGFNAEEVAALINANEDWHNDYVANLNAQKMARAAAVTKGTSKASVKALVRGYVRRLQVHPAITDNARETFRVTVPDKQRAPIGAPTETPLVRLDFSDRGRMYIHFGPNPSNKRNNGLPEGAGGVIIQCHESGVPQNETAWAWLANPSRSPYTHVVNGSAARTFAYRCAYVNRRGQQGPWSAPAIGTVTA